MQQVDQDLAQSLGVAADGREVRGDVHAEGHALAVGEEAKAFRRLGRQPAQIHVLERAEAAAALDPRQVQQFADHLDEVAGLHLDLADPVAHLGRQGVTDRVGLAGQGLGQEADRRERRPQLVREVVDELRPDALQPAQLGGVRQHEGDAAGRGPGRRG